eukprot:TRINITY_DN72073_c0_g1_i2.p1 TRINITY_DN72073_c0_g1~~TRINITY_DN72073_c0_g1_i2.p1  ORF type:complete len:109 (+),score=2.28 TRINITY_DN72073_c0_g1_i2:31-327(+)
MTCHALVYCIAMPGAKNGTAPEESEHGAEEAESLSSDGAPSASEADEDDDSGSSVQAPTLNAHERRRRSTRGRAQVVRTGSVYKKPHAIRNFVPIFKL